jgi:hypothetical protein
MELDIRKEARLQLKMLKRLSDKAASIERRVERLESQVMGLKQALGGAMTKEDLRKLLSSLDGML